MGRAAAASWTFHSVYRFHHLADTHRPWTTDWILFFFFVFLPALLSRTTINRRNRIMWPLSLGTQQAGLVESFRFPRSETLRRRRCSIFISFCVATRELGGFFSSLIVLVSPVRVWLSLWSKASGRFFFSFDCSLRITNGSLNPREVEKHRNVLFCLIRSLGNVLIES